jgi:hypothetical protein
MVNMPYRSSESLMVEHISLRHWLPPRGMLLAFLAAFLIAALLFSLPSGTKVLHDLVPLDDPAMAAILTA